MFVSYPLGKLYSQAQIFNLLLTFKVDIVNKHHDHVIVQVLHHIFESVMGFISNVCIDLGCSLNRIGQVNVEDVTGVVVFDLFQEILQRVETSAHCNSVTNIQLVVVLALANHVEKMLEGLIDLTLV